MYKQCLDKTGAVAVCIIRMSDSGVIPFDPANTDYQTFKSDIEAGAELQDADGNVMSPEAVQAFLQTLPER